MYVSPRERTCKPLRCQHTRYQRHTVHHVCTWFMRKFGSALKVLITRTTVGRQVHGANAKATPFRLRKEMVPSSFRQNSMMNFRSDMYKGYAWWKHCRWRARARVTHWVFATSYSGPRGNIDENSSLKTKAVASGVG